MAKPHKKPKEAPAFGTFKKMNEETYRLQTDDGLRPDLWAHAHVVLLGVSGTGKTSVAKELAKRNVRAAVCPIVLYVELPSVLKTLDERRLFALRMDPKALCDRRQRRAAEEKLGPDYASWDQVRLEIEDARRKLMAYPNCKRVDASYDTIGAVASEVIRLLRVEYGEAEFP